MHAYFRDIIETGGSWIPPDGVGEFDAATWAMLVGVTAACIRRHVNEHKIPVREFAGKMFIAPEDIRAAIPAMVSTRKPRGGVKRRC